MLTLIADEDDRRRSSTGLVLSVAQKDGGALRLSLDRVATTDMILPNRWDFKGFQNHFEIDPSVLSAVEAALNKPASERSEDGICVPDDVLCSIGQALLVHIIAAALDARKAGAG